MLQLTSAVQVPNINRIKCEAASVGLLPAGTVS